MGRKFLWPKRTASPLTNLAISRSPAVILRGVLTMSRHFRQSDKKRGPQKVKTTLIQAEPRARIILRSSWPKKELADYHLEGLLFCEFGCRYCSSNAGLHLRFQKRTLNRMFREETG